MKLTVNQNVRILHIPCIAPHPMNPTIVVIVVMSKVIHVRSKYPWEKIWSLISFFFFLDYYKLNRLYKALALQKQTNHGPRMSKGSHQRRVPRHMHHQAQEVIPTEYSTSPPTPTPANIDRLSPFYTQQAFLPIPTTATGSRKSKY